MVPHDTESLLPRPSTASPASAPIAPVAAPTNAAAISEVMLGMISAKMIRSDPSPENFAAVTKSRLRSVMIWARLRPGRAGPRRDRDDADDQADAPDSEYATRVMINGSTGMTRKSW